MSKETNLRTVVEGILDKNRDAVLESHIQQTAAHTQDPDKNAFKGGDAGAGSRDDAETSGFSDTSNLGEGDDNVLANLDKALGSIAGVEDPDFDDGGDDDLNTPAGSTVTTRGSDNGDDPLHDGPIGEGSGKPKREEDDDEREESRKRKGEEDEKDDQDEEDFLNGESNAILNALGLLRN